LQNLIYEPPGMGEIVKRIRQTVPHLLWKCFRPNFGGRASTVVIGVIEVERERLRVERLMIVILLLARIRGYEMAMGESEAIMAALFASSLRL